MYDCKGNVGQLKNDIKLMSARAFAQTITNNESVITISCEDAAKVIGSNVNFRNMRKDYVIFDGKGSALHSTVSKDDDLYDNLLNTLNELNLQNYSKQEIEKAINSEINKYFKLDSNDDFGNDEATKRFVSDEMIELSKIVLDLAKDKLDKSYNSSNVFTLSLHLQTTINRLKSGQTIKNNKINHIRKKYPKEFITALEAVEKIEKRISISIPLNEVGFITLLLVSMDIDNNAKNNSGRVGILVVSHGECIASSMLSLANKMLGKNVGLAIDVPLEKASELTINEIIEAVKKVDEGKGVLILIDMGLVTNVKDVIIAKSGIQVEVIERVSTPMLIRAIEKSLTFESTVKEFRKEMMFDFYQDTICLEAQKDSINEKNMIIVYCITGRGTSVRLKEYICENISKQLLNKVEIHIEDEEFINLTEDKIKLKYDNRILAVVGTFRKSFQDITFISSDEILLQEGIRRLTAVIESIEGYNPYKEGETSLSKVLKFVNPLLLVKELKKVIINFENHFNTDLDPKIIAIIILHMGCMIEDLILGKKLKAFDDYLYAYQKHEAQIKYLKNSFKQLEKMFDIILPDEEIARLTEIMMEN